MVTSLRTNVYVPTVNLFLLKSVIDTIDDEEINFFFFLSLLLQALTHNL